MTRNSLYIFAAALVAGILWLKFIHDPAQRREERVALQTHITDSLAGAADAERVKDSLATARLTDSLARHAAVRTVIRQRVDTLTVTLREALPDTLRPRLDSLTAAHAAEVPSYQGDISALRFRLGVKDSLIASQEGLRQRLTAERDTFAKQAGRKWHLGVGVGLVGNQAGLGPGVFLGLSWSF